MRGKNHRYSFLVLMALQTQVFTVLLPSPSIAQTNQGQKNAALEKVLEFRKTLADRFDVEKYGIHTMMQNYVSDSGLLSVMNDILDPSDGYLCDESTAIIYSEATRLREEGDGFDIKVEPWEGADQYALFSHMYPKLLVDNETFTLDFVPPYILKDVSGVKHHDFKVISESEMGTLLKTNGITLSNRTAPFRYQTTSTGGDYLSMVGITSGPIELLPIVVKYQSNQKIPYVVSFESFYVSPNPKTIKPNPNGLPPHPFLHIEIEFSFSKLYDFAFKYKDQDLLNRHGYIQDDEFREFYRALLNAGIVRVTATMEHPTLKRAFGKYGQSEAELAYGQFLDYFVKWISLRRD